MRAEKTEKLPAGHAGRHHLISYGILCATIREKFKQLCDAQVCCRVALCMKRMSVAALGLCQTWCTAAHQDIRYRFGIIKRVDYTVSVLQL